VNQWKQNDRQEEQTCRAEVHVEGTVGYHGEHRCEVEQSQRQRVEKAKEKKGDAPTLCDLDHAGVNAEPFHRHTKENGPQ